MVQDELSAFVAGAAAEYGIPGVAVGVWSQGHTSYACHGLTSVENALAMDEHTLFQTASVSKTFTGTALMRLVDAGRMRLDEPVRRYVPELQLKDERVAGEMTVMHLLNHTSGLDWNLICDTGDGDDALAAFVARMDELDQIAPLGEKVSYSQAGFNLLGRVIEKVTGQTYEDAVAALVLQPLGLTETFFGTKEVMTRRFSVGHNPGPGEEPSVARPWPLARCQNPGGGVIASASDLLRWAAFHMGDGRAEDGTRILPGALMRAMRTATAQMRASTLGDALGIAWFIRDVGGVGTIGHGGSADGQYTELLLVPERDFAVVSFANANPNGIRFNQDAVRWTMERFLGVLERAPEPLAFDGSRAAEVVGAYENGSMTVTVTAAEATLRMEVVMKPQARATAKEIAEMPDYPPFDFGLLGDDEYVFTDGAFTGIRGFFHRDEAGKVVGIDLAGREYARM